MLTLTANNAIEITVPVSWDETTTALFQKIIKEWDMDKPMAERDPIKLFSIISGQPYNTIHESEDYNVHSTVNAVCAYVYHSDLPTEVKADFMLLNKVVSIPKDLSGMTVGQAIQIRQKMDTVKDVRELISFACAVFLQPYFDGEKVNDRFKKAQFDMERVRQLEEAVLEMPITYTYPIGFFFLTRLNISGMMPIQNYQQTKLTGLKKWLQRWLMSRSFNRFFIWASLMYSLRNSALTQTTYIISLFTR